MSTGDDDLSSGINGRLRPRKPYVSSHQAIKFSRRLESKSQEKQKRITTPSKNLLNKQDDLPNKSDCTTIEFLCPYCDKSFVSKQAASKHARRTHLSISKQDSLWNCLFCTHTEAEPNNIVRHMIDTHSNQYFTCLDCHTRFPSETELSEHKLNVCDTQKLPYTNKLRKKLPRSSKKSNNLERQVAVRDEDRHGYNGVVISCELKPTHDHDPADIEDNITTNLILPPGKNLGHKIIDKNAVIVLDDLQWNKRIPHNFSFHNTEADQILSRLGVVHRSPRTAESTRKDWFKAIDDASQKFERCFDTIFYSKVASNVHENLSKFLDGSFNFNPDPNHTIKTRKAKNSVPINTVEGFPILLSCEQYSRNLFDGYMPRAIAPKHKWKWDNLESDKNAYNPDVIKRDSHVNNCIVTLVSSLDIWTQLCMRRKFEEKYKNTPVERKTEKRNIIGKELKEILESRQLPASSSQISRNNEVAVPLRGGLDFPASLGLTPTVPKYEVQPAVLSGEWVRPRCYVCCACGAQTRDPRALSSHISTEHPNAQVQHYEIAGELLLNADILKYLYVPPSPVHNRTRPLRGFRECTKCNKSITLEDLHSHMLDCAGDMPAVRRKCRYRQFGVRKRRTRLPDNRIRKKIRKEIHRQNGRPTPKIRTEVGDAETIRKMLADLPAKRQRVAINPLNPTLRPRRKLDKQNNQLTLITHSTEDNIERKTNASSSTCSGEISENIDLDLDLDDNRPLKSTIKRVHHKLPRHNETINKTTASKLQKKQEDLATDTMLSYTNLNKDSEPGPSEVSNTDQTTSQSVQTNQLSNENVSNRIDVNAGPSNTREHGNRSGSNGSNNRDHQNPDRNDHNGNSREQGGAPPQNIQLKHSIARLTADSDTQDKAVQFHHLFLVQQECNNVPQHVPSGQRMLFENKAFVTKLDKPPLQNRLKDDILESQSSLKGKSSKPRKKLNDCIAMLKNKLFEPNPNTPNVSIQCQIDETDIPSSHNIPKTVRNSNRIDITVQCPDTDDTTTDTIITPRRRQSINADKNQVMNDQLPKLQTISEYFKQNPHLLLQQQLYNTESTVMNKRDAELVHHPMSVKDKSSPNVQKPIQPQDNNSKINKTLSKVAEVRHLNQGNVEKTKPHKNEAYRVDMRQPDNLQPQGMQIPCQTKQLTEANVTNKIPTSRTYTDYSIEKNHDIKQNNQNIPVPPRKSQDVRHQNTDGRNIQKDQMKPKKSIPSAHCNAGVESILTAPLDLSGKHYANEAIAHCSTQDLPYDSTRGEYETLDLSNKPQIHPQSNECIIMPFNDEIVDLRVKHIPTTQSADSSLFTEESTSNLNTATDLSFRGDMSCIPTDLSIKMTGNTSSANTLRNINPANNLYNNISVTGLQEDGGVICLNLSAQYLETPTDLSKNSIRTDMINPTVQVPIETTVIHNYNTARTENTEYVTPADLSTRSEKQQIMASQSQAKSNVIISTENIADNDLNNRTRKLSSSISIPKNRTFDSVDIEPHETLLSQERILQYHTNQNELNRKCSSITTGDATISLTRNSIPKNDQTNRGNEVGSINVINNLSKTHSSINSQYYGSYRQNQSMQLTRGKCETSVHDAILPHATKSAGIQDSMLVSSSKLMHEITANAIPPPRISEPLQRVSFESNPSTSFMEKVLDKKTHGTSFAEIEHERHSEANDKLVLTTLDHDPETAKKIAMLPKELVDILGNMPVDHRNQLLNVLPQYVSTSTPTHSTAIHNKSQNNEFIHNSLPYCNIPQFSEKQRNQHIAGDVFRLNHSSPIFMRSYNELHSNPMQITDDTLLGKVKNETISTHDDDTMKISNYSIVTENIIIDLTDDQADIPQKSTPEKENKISGVILKPLVQKPNNDKTASLRAVRIKTPSERQKNLITDTQSKKSYQDNNNTIQLHNSEKKTEELGFLAVQQFEITTTEETKVVNSKPTVSGFSKKPDSSFKINIEQQVPFAPPKTVIKDMNSLTCGDNNSLKLNISSSNVASYTSINDLPLTKTVLINNSVKHYEPKSSEIAFTNNDDLQFNSKAELELNIPNTKHTVKDIYEDDSEDDVSLAIIVKQKLRDQVSQSDLSENGNTINEKIDTPQTGTNATLISYNKEEQTYDIKNDNNDNKISQNIDRSSQGVKEKHSKNNKGSRKTNNSNIPEETEDKFDADVNQIYTVCSDETNIAKLDNVVQKSTENNFEKINCPESEGVSSDNNDCNSFEEIYKSKEYSEVSGHIQNRIDTAVREQLFEENTNSLRTDIKVKKKNSVRYNLNTEDLICDSKTVVSEESVIMQAMSEPQSHLIKQMPEKLHTNITIQLEHSVMRSDEKNKIKDGNKCDNIAQTNHSLNVNISDLPEEDMVTPLRRSRRGKSLFVENTDLSEDKNQADNGIDHRGPFTKKQLIFSKLLLDRDETIHNMHSSQNNDASDEQTNEEKSTGTTSFANKNPPHKSHKRKQSPQITKKHKRKKSLVNSEDIMYQIKEPSIMETINPETPFQLISDAFLTENFTKVLEALDDSNEFNEDVSSSDTCSKSLSVKRKCSNSSTVDTTPSSFSKKIKCSFENDSNKIHTKDNKNKDNKLDENTKEVHPVMQEKKPGRRGRSKSVFVKSSAPKLYDPYDINLEDMVPKTEPFFKKRTLLKNPATVQVIKDLPISDNFATLTSNVTDNNGQENRTHDVPGKEIKGLVSDSDDSSKSDIPLKKYAEEKEKKKNDEDPNKNMLRKRNKHVVPIYSDKINEEICPDDNEERLRSEQFMESFGFFSERKPRKSNLLATKKISETFHIIANEKDDSIFEPKEKVNNRKLGQCDDKKNAHSESILSEPIAASNKKVSKRGRKKKISTKIELPYCGVCRKEFRRPDNFIRHQMTLAHVTRVSEEISKVKSQDTITIEESNYLVIYKHQLDRLRVLQDKITQRKKYCRSLNKIALPTLEEIIADVTKTVQEQLVARRQLSRDEALFLDCCELLNGSHEDGTRRRKRPGCINCLFCAETTVECLNLLEKRINETLEGNCDDGDVDSITAQNILESEEVRNLENDLISGLKEAASANSFNGNALNSSFTSDADIETHNLNKVVINNPESLRQADEVKDKCKKGLEVKEKMYPDVIEDINVFEDKFDKIKRKCRSKAAKQTQYVETITSHKSRKKNDKKKRKKSPKKNQQSSVPTKGALKGFDGVKVSISTTDIDMSSILPLAGPSQPKKKKRKSSKRKREHATSDAARSDYEDKNRKSQNKPLDVYEFMDNEDVELFEFRPSTLMERFKSIGNKDMPSTSKSQPAYNDRGVSNESGSDGDDFVYMSDDYVCSDAETENSLVSCDMIKSGSEIRKPSTPPKRKETAEKNVVMGKIFKHNAVRSEKKCTKTKEPPKAKANLDQLFDSLLEEEPNSSMLAKNSLSPKHDHYDGIYTADSPSLDRNDVSSALKGDENLSLSDDTDNELHSKARTPSPLPYTSLVSYSKKRKSLSPVRKIGALTDDQRYAPKIFPSTSKAHELKNSFERDHKKSSHRKKNDLYAKYGEATLKRRSTYSPNYDDDSLLRVDDTLPSISDSFTYTKRKSKEKGMKNKSVTKSIDTVRTSLHYSNAVYVHADNAGVATQRARRKCTVGKQNVLAETWSSESEPDGVPPRPNSAESVVVGVSRKKKGRKKEGQAFGSRKGSSRQGGSRKAEAEDSSYGKRSSYEGVSRVLPTSRPSAVGAGKKVRPRVPPYYWSDEEEQRVQQHGWIVGDSHKKLVTMLAHAKGKRNNDDRRHVLE